MANFQQKIGAPEISSDQVSCHVVRLDKKNARTHTPPHTHAVFFIFPCQLNTGSMQVTTKLETRLESFLRWRASIYSLDPRRCSIYRGRKTTHRESVNQWRPSTLCNRRTFGHGLFKLTVIAVMNYTITRVSHSILNIKVEPL